MPITNSSIFVEVMRSCLLILCILSVFNCRAQERVVPLVRDGARLYADVTLGDSVRVRALLESGIPFPLIGEKVVRRNPELFELQKLDSVCRFRMAGGVTLTAGYKLAPGIRIGAARTLCESYVVDMEGCDMMFPLQTCTTDSLDRPGVFLLDIRSERLAMLRPGDLSAPGGMWRILEMNRDEGSGMFTVAGSFRLADEEKAGTETTMEFTVDLGNANLLALFAAKPGVAEFIDASPVRKNEGETPQGMKFRVLQPAVATFFGDLHFENQTIILIDKTIRVPGDGFLGTQFFAPYRVVLDFRNGRLWLANSDERQ